MSSSRRQYPFHLIEPKWQQHWEQQQSFRAWNPGETVPASHPFAQRHGATLPPKYYILDMFPYPSGAGLHVGHPEGYTATDILARYQRARGRNVLHPMGWDAFGLPAEQYAVKTGQHPRHTTEANITTFKRQIKSLGFSYDWSREVDTTDPKYFKWTQWIFLQLYNSWFNPETNKAEPISTLKYPADLEGDGDEVHRQALRDCQRLAYVEEAPVWWCEELGTVLANEEVVDGKSEVGGFPVTRKPMRQWMLRITVFAERLLQDLEKIDWSNSLKEMQRNWIGKSEGTHVKFEVEDIVPAPGGQPLPIWVFTTRPDTLFGATYIVLSPEHKLVDIVTTAAQRKAVEDYKKFAATKSDLERTELAKEKTGVFTGAYAINPVNNERIPIWIADYVLASYGTGAIMAVPAHDDRDMEFAIKFIKFKLKLRPVVEPSPDWLVRHFKFPHGAIRLRTPLSQAVSDPDELDLLAREFKNCFGVTKELVAPWLCLLTEGEQGKKPTPLLLLQFYRQFPQLFTNGERPVAFCESGQSINSAQTKGADRQDFNGIDTPSFRQVIADWLERKRLGKRTVNYKLRDWLFSRQRYWGEPFPIVWKKDAGGNLYHEALTESALPVLPPPLDDYKPTSDGQPPLARAKEWVENISDIPGATRETNTMPQWAGSCWYYLRYLDAANAQTFCGKEAESYWMGTSRTGFQPVSPGILPVDHPGAGSPGDRLEACPTPGVDLYVGGTEHAVLHLLYARFWHKVLFDLGHVSTAEPFFKLVNQGLILGEDGQKMSKSRGNVVNPDDILGEYGADAFRLYEMFMGPLEMVKPWNTKGVEGVYRFLGRVWRLFVDEQSETEFEQTAATASAHDATLLEKIRLNPAITDATPAPAQLKALHACIKKVTEDLDGMRFNTAISAMMVFVNEAMTWATKPREVLQNFLLLLQPFAPHVAEELWAKIHSAFRASPSALAYAHWPAFDPALLVEDTIEIPVQVNGKLRDVMKVSASATQAELESTALACERAKAFLEGKTIRKIIVVPKKLVNIVVS